MTGNKSRLEQEQKDSIEHLMYYMENNHYKEMCDKIKVAILDSFIGLCLKKEKGVQYLTVFELSLIKKGIEDLRAKEKEAETQAIVDVIDNLISRGTIR